MRTSETSGRIGHIEWYVRDYLFRTSRGRYEGAAIVPNEGTAVCGHRHIKAERADECARKLARRFFEDSRLPA